MSYTPPNRQNLEFVIDDTYTPPNRQNLIFVLDEEESGFNPSPLIPDIEFVLDATITGASRAVSVPESEFSLETTLAGVLRAVSVPEIEMLLEASISGIKLIDLTETEDAIVRYFLTITGDADNTTDVQIPMSSFQARRRNDAPTYLSVVIPSINFADEIISRSNGFVRIDQAYTYQNEIVLKKTIIETTIDRVDTDQGGKNRSVTLVGYKTDSYNPKSVALEYATYRSFRNGTLRYRLAKPYIFLNPGDTVTIGNDTFKIGVISYAISVKNKLIEIEAE